MKKMSKWAVTLTLLLVAAACGDSKEGGTPGAATAPPGSGAAAAPTTTVPANLDASLSWGGPSYVGTTLDPHAEVSVMDFIPAQYIYDRLIYIDKDRKLKPMIATEWKFSADGKQLTMTIRNDALFHDGSKVDAAAVKASLDRAKTKGSAAVTGLLLALDTVDVVDANTVRLNLNRPAAELPYNLARNAGAVINPKAIAAGTVLTNNDANMAGSGPYVVGPGGFTPLTTIELVRASTTYWDKDAAKIKTIKLNAVQDPNTLLNAVKSGELEGGSAPSTLWDAASNISGKTLNKLVTGSVQGLLMKDQRPNMSNVKVRQAVAYAIDRDAITKGLLQNTCAPTDQYFPKGSLGYSDTLKYAYPYDEAKAKQLLTEAGFPNGITLSVTVPAGQEPAPSIATAVQAQLKKSGINLELSVGPAATGLADFQANKFDIDIVTNVGQVHPSTFVSRIFFPNGALYRLTSGPAGDQLVSLVNAALDPALNDTALNAQWTKIAQYLQDNMWFAPICFSQSGYIFPNDVKNVENMSWVWGSISDFRYLYRTAK
jgi:ABC-type transport system substrate-binding protein